MGRRIVKHTKNIAHITVVVDTNFDKGDVTEVYTSELGGMVDFYIDNNNLTIKRGKYTIAYYPAGYWLRMGIEWD